MELDLDLTNVFEDLRYKFCEFIVNRIKAFIIASGEQSKYETMEEYINENKIIDWISNKKQYISVYDLYRLAASYLTIKQVNETNFKIELDNNANIPLAYTKLYSIVSLLEYGTMSVRKCGTLSNIMEDIIKKLNSLYKQFLMEANK